MQPKVESALHNFYQEDVFICLLLTSLSVAPVFFFSLIRSQSKVKGIDESLSFNRILSLRT